MTENIDCSINYIELPMTDPAATIAFYEGLFGWAFTQWGPDYISFAGAGIEGGFNREDGVEPARPGVLVILYAKALDAMAEKVAAAGGRIIKPAYAFPGGRRFHFTDPNGNELAIWSES